MRNRSAVFVAIIVAGLSAPAVVYAAPASSDAPVHALLAKSKTVKVAMRNDSGSPVELKVGDQTLSIDAGKTVALKLPVGTRILVNAATPKHPAGELLAEVSAELDNATIAIK
jgi:hypothetical protein